MKGKIILGVVVGCMLSCVFMPMVGASLEKPSFVKGDYWEYKITEEPTGSIQGTARFEITGEKTITVDGKSYEVWEATGNMEWSSDNVSMTTDDITYLRKSDGALIKSIEDVETITPGGPYSFHSETVYKTIQPDFEYPINVGDIWERHKQIEVTDDTGTHTDWEDAHYECTGTKELTIDAGTFSCYIIKIKDEDSDENNYVLQYHSNKVGGNFVKMEIYENGVIVGAMTLTSYNYEGERGNGENGGNGGIPGFELTFLIIAIASIIFLKRRNKEN